MIANGTEEANVLHIDMYGKFDTTWLYMPTSTGLGTRLRLKCPIAQAGSITIVTHILTGYKYHAYSLVSTEIRGRSF